MQKVDVPVGGVRFVQAHPPHEAVVVLQTTTGQDVAVHIRPKEIHRLHELLGGIIQQFPDEEGAR